MVTAHWSEIAFWCAHLTFNGFFIVYLPDAYEEVDLISKGGNYGWRVYEGPYIYRPEWTPGGNTSLSSINAIFPVMGYNHSSVNNNVGSASITGGYVYRGSTDPCLYGRYTVFAREELQVAFPCFGGT